MEIWKSIKDFDQYEISSYGNVKSLGNNASRKERILKQSLNHKGYLRVALYFNKKAHHKSVHRLVAEAFIPNIESKAEVNHIDGNKENNSIQNLEWNTHEENMNHSIKTKISACGERSGRSKLKEKEVFYIYECLKDGVEVKVLMRYFNVSKSCIMGIKTGDWWKHLELKPLSGRASVVQLKDILIIEEGLKTTTIRELSRNSGYSRELIKKIKTGYYENLKNRLQELQSSFTIT